MCTRANAWGSKEQKGAGAASFAPREEQHVHATYHIREDDAA